MTGASAGNINALLTILSLCSKPQSNPQRSLFGTPGSHRRHRAVQAPLALDPPDRGYGALSSCRCCASPATSSAPGPPASTRNATRRWPSTTRLKSAEVTLQDGFKVPRQEEKFVVRIKGRGDGRAPYVSNYIDPNDALPRPLLPSPPSRTPSTTSSRRSRCSATCCWRQRPPRRLPPPSRCPTA